MAVRAIFAHTESETSSPSLKIFFKCLVIKVLSTLNKTAIL